MPNTRRPWRAAVQVAVILAGLGLNACSSYDPAALNDGEEFDALATEHRDQARGHRILIARVVGPPEGPAASDESRRAPLPFDARDFHDELVQALTVVLGRADDAEAPPTVTVAQGDDAALEAWRDGSYDLVLEARVQKWEVVFLDTNGWWWPNALLVAWYLWPTQWLIADELFGVDCEVVFDVLSVASERPLPNLDDRVVRVTTELPEDERDLEPLDVVQPPRQTLDDIDRGLDLFGTYFPGQLDPEQWEQVGLVMEPFARRVTSVRVGAAIGDAIERFEALSELERAEALAAVHALVVGVSSYNDECLYADRDAENFAQLLTGIAAPSSGTVAGPPEEVGPEEVGPEKVGEDAGERGAGRRPLGSEGPWAPRKNVVTRINGLATREAVLADIARISSRSAPQDEVVFYFAGRGRTLPGRRGLDALALRTYPSESGEWITLSELADAITAVPGRRRLLLLDADFGAGPRGHAGRDLEVPNLDALLRDAFLQGIASGGVVLATVPGRETQAHVYDEQGLLTQYLLRGLAGEADEGGDGLTFDDLNTYLNRFVVNLSEVAMPSPQRPLVVSVSPRDRVR